MNCHSQIWSASPSLNPVRESFFAGVEIAWHRVNVLPDFVYFNHSIHVQKGVGCVTCHGRIDEMAQTAKGAPLTMGWCLDCHRSPDGHLRALDAITQTDPIDITASHALAREYAVRPSTHCTTCHR